MQGSQLEIKIFESTLMHIVVAIQFLDTMYSEISKTCLQYSHIISNENQSQQQHPGGKARKQVGHTGLDTRGFRRSTNATRTGYGAPW